MLGDKRQEENLVLTFLCHLRQVNTQCVVADEMLISTQCALSSVSEAQHSVERSAQTLAGARIFVTINIILCIYGSVVTTSKHDAVHMLGQVSQVDTHHGSQRTESHVQLATVTERSRTPPGSRHLVGINRGSNLLPVERAGDCSCQKHVLVIGTGIDLAHAILESSRSDSIEVGSLKQCGILLQGLENGLLGALTFLQLLLVVVQADRTEDIHLIVFTPHSGIAL